MRLFHGLCGAGGSYIYTGQLGDMKAAKKKRGKQKQLPPSVSLPMGTTDRLKKVQRKERKPVSKYEITDERFAAAQTDPRFHRFPKAKQKLEVDERFAGQA